MSISHLSLGALAFGVVRDNRIWLFPIELLFLISLAASLGLVRELGRSREILQVGGELLRERDFTSRFRPVGEPHTDALITVYNEMAERLRDERLRLEEQQLFLRKLVEASPAGLLIFDLDSKLCAANPAAERLLGRSAGELQDKSLGELAGALADLPVGGSRLVTLGGRQRLKCSRAEFFDRGFARSFVLLEELTEELRASEKGAYEKLIRMLAHEVNNSTGAVGSLLESCRHYGHALGSEDRHDFEEALGVAGERMRSLAGFMSGLSDLVRLPEPQRRPTDLAGLLDDLLRLLRPELERCRIAVRRQPARPTAGPGHPLMLDKEQIEQALLNVLKNAIEAIGEDGVIEIDLRLDEARPSLAIRDSGPGIAPELGSRLFTPFLTTKPNGRGLGLTIVREILGQHGLDFRLESMPQGGAEFHIDF